MSYKLSFIDSARFMANLNHNLVEGIHKIKCKYKYNNKKMWKVWD